MVLSFKSYSFILIGLLFFSCNKSFNSAHLFLNGKQYNNISYFNIDRKGIDFKKLDFEYNKKSKFEFRVSLFRDGFPYISSKWHEKMNDFVSEKEFITDFYVYVLEGDYLLIEVREKNNVKSFFFKPIKIENYDW